jgi:hypothetical protein
MSENPVSGRLIFEGEGGVDVAREGAALDTRIEPATTTSTRAPRKTRCVIRRCPFFESCGRRARRTMGPRSTDRQPTFGYIKKT